MIFPCAGWVLFLGCGRTDFTCSTIQSCPEDQGQVGLFPKLWNVMQTLASISLVFSLLSLPPPFIPKPSDVWVALWGGYPHSLYIFTLFVLIHSLPSILSFSVASHRATWPSEALLYDPLPHAERALLSLMFSCLTNYFNLSFLRLTPF